MNTFHFLLLNLQEALESVFPNDKDIKLPGKSQCLLFCQNQDQNHHGYKYKNKSGKSEEGKIICVYIICMLSIPTAQVQCTHHFTCFEITTVVICEAEFQKANYKRKLKRHFQIK